MLKQIFDPKKLLRSVCFAAIPAAVFYTLSFALLKWHGFAAIEIIRDAAQLTRTSSFQGFLSSTGSWLWVSASAICFFSLKLPHTATSKTRDLLALCGILSITLAVDDFFMLHDRYINQMACYIFYSIVALSILGTQFRLIATIDAPAYLLCCALLGASVGTDLLQRLLPLRYNHVQIIEEAFKFGGGAMWLYFCARVGRYQPEKIPDQLS